MAEQTKGRWCWVARDELYGAWYAVFLTKPQRSKLDRWSHTWTGKDGKMKRFCPRDFERFTGLKIKPGGLMRVRFWCEEK